MVVPLHVVKLKSTFSLVDCVAKNELVNGLSSLVGMVFAPKIERPLGGM